MAIVSLKDVKKIYPLGKTKVQALGGVSFEIEKGDFVSIAGPSGSGKSTILNLLGCIDTASSGQVVINGVETSTLNDKQITNLRHEVLGFIFQSFNLIPVLSVYENVEFPLLLGKNSMSKQETKQWISYLIDAVGLAKWATHKPNELSGGQRQRVAIARALATKPSIVMADEPTANLDSVTSEAIIDLMKKMNRELTTTFIFSTHDQDIVNIADHVIRLQDGLVVKDYKPSNGAHEAISSDPTAKVSA
jgi:putative ABC transport system ATP-binding protein